MTQKMGSLRREKKGFTLVEMLVVVAILIAVIAVSVVSITAIRKELRQKELDSKAETIYVAVQRRMAELCASGYEDLYQYEEGSSRGIEKVGLVPSDVDGDTEITEDTLCYVEAQKDADMSDAASDLVPEDSIDEALRSNQWHIEFDPDSGSVYGVFYSEAGDIPSDKNELDNLRNRKQRLKAGATVGYYGGDLTQNESTDTLYPGITIENKEELKAVFYCSNPSTTEELTFEITLSDGKNTYKKTVPYASLERVSSRIYRYTWVLDSLKSEKSRFYAQTEGKLTCGTDLNIKLSVSSTDSMVDTAQVEKTTNSLFDYRENSDSDTALISYGRHLQNLDEASHVSEKITKAVQLSDISFADNANDDADWYSLYKDYSFEPIENDNLTSYDGQSDLDGTQMNTSIYALHIGNEEGGEAGLFKTYSGSIKNVTLTGTKIEKGSDVGALIGKADGDVTIENCSVYLSSKQGDLEGITAVDQAEDVDPWIKGDTVGGLIGHSEGKVEIKNSFAATLLKGSKMAGGLIGSAEGNITANTVYADCYILAPQTGGLFANTSEKAEITLENFYAVGYQVGSKSEAGIAAGTVTSAKNGYCAIEFTGESDTKLYSTAESGSMSNVYYLTGSNPLSGSTSVSYKELSENGSEKLGSAFTSSSGSSSYPYNLMNQGLSTYSYPRLSELNHYGDWKAEFESGRLVYYERYEDGSYGFEGANVSTLSGSGLVLGDGYALAYTSDTKPAEGTQIKVVYGSANTEATITVGTMYTVSSGSEVYYLLPLPKEIVNPSLDGESSFYQKITISSDGVENEYYFNPYFAKTVTTNDKTPDAPDQIYIRSPRQLYALSRFYSKYTSETKKSVFEQELNLDYSSYLWSEYTAEGEISSQSPIDADEGFWADYNGSYHTISGLSITSSVSNTGLFGTIAETGRVRNLFLTGSVGSESITRTTSAGNVASGSSNSSNIGALAGVNMGTISNCAVSGYTIQYYGYNYNTVNLGGLVGKNTGTIRSSSADAADIEATGNRSYAYIGGFAGRNSGSIYASYATGHVSVLEARNATLWAAGFVGSNIDGAISRCYAATAITATGTAESYGFGRIGGTTADCYYLDGGTYSYAGSLYAYNTSANEFAQEGLAAGTKIDGDGLKALNLRDFGTAALSYQHAETTAEDNYGYPSSVSTNGQYVHFGNWPVAEDIGTLGIFYWEYESSGSNSGYHFSYIGTSNGAAISGSSLCQEHDDGGAITDYGYGYFYSNTEVMDTVSLSTENTCTLGERDTEAENEIAKQMAGYDFVAYKTSESGLHLNSSNTNATWKLTCGEAAYTYQLNPFFGESMRLDTVSIAGTSSSMGGSDIGSEENCYQIRSTQQLQFINWNYQAQTAAKSVTDKNYYQYYTYLSYLGYRNSYQNYTKDRSFVWNQSHDLDAAIDGSAAYFTPIGGLYDEAGLGTDTAKIYAAYFSSTYNGKDYTIKNIEISTTVQCVGLFGFTSGANLQNIVLYSDKEGGSTIENQAGGTNWYAVGGLVGFAGSANKSSSVFRNCTVSGYNIVDYRGYGLKNNAGYPGWGGGCVGGLVGATNMPIEGCTAVTDITIQIGYTNGYTNLRVGGIAGVSRGSIDSCYAGGSIVSTSNAGSGGPAANASIWAGGICGGIVLRYQGNISSLVGTVTNVLQVKNSYSYVKMPSSGSTGANNVRNSQSIASNGELQCSSYGKITNSNIEIYNCYAYADYISGCDDYKQYKNTNSWNGSGKKLNVGNNSGDSDSGRAITIYNSHKPYLTYKQMNDGTLLSYLQEGTDYFGTVTTLENGVAINGKYSFPGSDTQLKGLNYPFPTVLTQNDIYGNTVNVHYGYWPKYGIYWEKQSAEFDLYANRTSADSGETLSLFDVKLRLYGDDGAGLSEDDITFTDDEGNELTQDELPLEIYEISDLQTDSEGSYYTVTFKGLKTGIAFVHVNLDDREAEMTIDVVNEMTIQGAEDKVSLLAGEEKTVGLTFYVSDLDGNEVQLQPEKNKLSWSVSIKTGEDALICDDDSVSYDAASGTLNVTMTGRVMESLADADAHVSITCTYQYGDGENEKLEKTADLMVGVSSPDFAAVQLENESSGYRFDANGSTPRDIGGILDSLEGEGLYIRDSYAGLTLDMSSFTLELDGISYEADENGDIWKTNEDNEEELLAHIALGEGEPNESYNYTRYALAVEDYAGADDAVLKIQLRQDAVLELTVAGSGVQENNAENTQETS